jgi:hypothetical protein
MKTADAATVNRAAERAQRLAWLLELTHGSWSWRGATQSATVNGEFWPVRIAAVERFCEWLPESAREGGRARAEAMIAIPDRPDMAHSLRAELAVRAPLGIEARLRLAWLDADGAADDAPTFLRGRVAAWRIDPAGVAITLIDELSALSDRPVGRLLRAGMLAGMDADASGRPLPWIFGRVAGCALVPLRTGARSRLAAPVAVDAGVVPLLSLDGFPPSGAVQIRGELIAYSAIDSAAGTIGTALLPVARGPGALDYSAGEPVRHCPAAGFLLLAADHPCRAIESVEVDGLPIEASAWTAESLNLGGEEVQAVRFDSWPLDAEGRHAEAIAATVEGLADADGALAENPAAILLQLLTHPRFGGLDAARIDAAKMDAAAAMLEARGVRLARRVASEESLGALIDSAAREGGVWLQSGDPIAAVAVDAVPHAAAVVDALEEGRWLEPAMPARIESPAGGLIPDAVELIGPQNSNGARNALQFPPESAGSGVRPRRIALQWLDPATGGGADLGERLWRRLGEAPFVHRPDAAPGALMLACGDTVCIGDAALDLVETLAWVRSIETGSGSGESGRARVELWGPWAGAYVMRHDLNNHLRRFSFGAHLLFTVDGRPVALLTRGGTLRLAGRMRESAALPAPASDGPIAFENHAVLLSTGAPGNWIPFLRIDAEGEAQLAGTLRERSTALNDPAGEAHGAQAGRAWLSSDGRAPALEYEVSAARLHLAGILIESVRF